MAFVKKMKVAVALSGGVDSAVAASECIRQGYECIGVTMRIVDNEVSGAQRIADRLGIPFNIFDARDEFERKVIKPFTEGYINGVTPNPCVDCNREMKFGKLLDFALGLGANYLATGHYARVKKNNDRFMLLKAFDENKDQSYYLYRLTQKQLSRTMFPLGEMLKPTVRDLALQKGLINTTTPESQDICFIPDGDYAAFIEDYTKKSPEPGDFIGIDGNILGRHKGLIHYTVGQRKGLGIAWKFPLYVCAKNAETNTVTLCEDNALFSNTLSAIKCNWITPAPTEPFKAKTRIRYRQTEQWAMVTPTPDNSMQIIFNEPQRAIAKGQHVVIYSEDTVLGGGVIT
jgi:tRNA-specific 2-thiouridylase